MKRTLVFLLFIGTILFLSPQLASAQNQIGAYVGPNITWIKHSSKLQNRFYNPKTTFSGEVGVDFIHYFDNKHRSKLIGGRLASGMKSRFAIRGGLHYIAINQKWDAEYRVNERSNIVTKEHTGKIRLDYIKLLMAAQYSYPLTHKLKSKFFGGLQPGYLIKADGGLVEYIEYKNHDYFNLPESKMDYYNRFSLDIVAGAGLDYQMSRWWNLTAMLRFDYSMLASQNLENVPSDVQLYSPGQNSGGAHNIVVGLLIGAEYYFHKPAHSRTKF